MIVEKRSLFLEYKVIRAQYENTLSNVLDLKIEVIPAKCT